MQQAEARGEALTKSRRYSKAGGYSGSGGAAAVHFLNKLASLASFICRLALSPLSLLSHIWMENWQALCQQSHECLFSNLPARCDEFFGRWKSSVNVKFVLMRSLIICFLLIKRHSLLLRHSRVEIFSWRSNKQTNKHTNKLSAVRSIARAPNRWRGIKYSTFSGHTHRIKYI